MDGNTNDVDCSDDLVIQIDLLGLSSSDATVGHQFAGYSLILWIGNIDLEGKWEYKVGIAIR